MNHTSRIGGTCAAPDCYHTVLFSSTAFCSLHQSLGQTPPINNDHSGASQLGTFRPSGRVLTARRGRQQFWRPGLRNSVRSREASRESLSTRPDTQAEQPNVTQLKNRTTSTQFLTRRGDGEERERDDAFRGQKEEDTVSNLLSKRSSPIDRSTNAALQTGMTQSSAGTAKKVTAARIDLTDTSSLLRAPRINSQPGVENLTSIPREYPVTERVVSPVANKEPPLHPSRKPKLDTKSSGHVPLSFSSKSSTPTAKKPPENLLNMSEPAFDSEPKRSQGLSPQTTFSPKVLIRSSRPYEVAPWSKHPEKALPKEALPMKASLEKERPLRDILLPKVRAKIDNGANKASKSDSSDGTTAQAIQAALLSLRTKTGTDKEKPLATFDPVAFDSIIYRQSRLRPPPGVRLSSRIVKNGSASHKSERVYLPVNPAIHKMHKRSQHWYKQKCEEIKRRPSRKAWFGKVEARLRWLRAEEERLEQSRQCPK
ncbi:hypothetical protein HYE68_008372 [Fusarium pseudograminearum]|nr:hypothetical protein HYE68_008372 [Fusarium pseudograminearum]